MVSAFCIGWAIHSYRAYLENVYHNYRQYVQAHMRKVTCDGKQQVEKESGQCTFHLDGHTKQHDTNSKENHPSL